MPILFFDRRAGQSKMTRREIVEGALRVRQMRLTRRY
jgi:hypothetical protein